MICQYPCGVLLCGNPANQCECCDNYFCSDHGTVAGDREGREGEVAQAYPSVCWKCGGFNVDE